MVDGLSDSSRVAADCLQALRSKSPTSLLVTLEQLKRGGTYSLKECFEMEYRICFRMLQGLDFYEGVRAVLVDKDKSPNWQPQTIAEVDATDVLRYFEQLGSDELQLEPDRELT